MCNTSKIFGGEDEKWGKNRQAHLPACARGLTPLRGVSGCSAQSAVVAMFVEMWFSLDQVFAPWRRRRAHCWVHPRPWPWDPQPSAAGRAARGRSASPVSAADPQRARHSANLSKDRTFPRKGQRGSNPLQRGAKGLENILAPPQKKCYEFKCVLPLFS